ncbi:hypothetical protein HK096_010085 [Nowakowskiella sp. JEL0078]|nr:hypothetical protein HK096_010085 [Nowakowskiella sp. JEL0078]
MLIEQRKRGPKKSSISSSATSVQFDQVQTARVSTSQSAKLTSNHYSTLKVPGSNSVNSSPNRNSIIKDHQINFTVSSPASELVTLTQRNTTPPNHNRQVNNFIRGTGQDSFSVSNEFFQTQNHTFSPSQLDNDDFLSSHLNSSVSSNGTPFFFDHTISHSGFSDLTPETKKTHSTQIESPTAMTPSHEMYFQHQNCSTMFNEQDQGVSFYPQSLSSTPTQISSGITQAASLIPDSAGKQTKGFEQLETCQSSLILSLSEYGASVGEKQWMFSGMGCRLAQKLDLPFEETVDDFLSYMNGRPKPAISCSRVERKRTWWACLVVDFCNSLTTATPLMINENEYAPTMMDDHTLLSRDSESTNSILIDSTSQLLSIDDGNRDAWKECLSGFPKYTIFEKYRYDQVPESSDVYSIKHLYSSNSETLHFMQLNFLVRHVMRLNLTSSGKNFSLNRSAVSLLSLTTQPANLLTLHDELIQWYERLPPSFRLFDSMEVLMGLNYQNVYFSSIVAFSKRLSSTCVTTNLLYFCTLVLLHQRRVSTPALKNDPAFRISTTQTRSLFGSLDICVMAYKAQCHLLRLVYASNKQFPLSTEMVVPPELASTPMTPCFLMLTALTLLSSKDHAGALIADPSNSPPVTFANGELDSLQALFIPIIESLSKVWMRGSVQAKQLRDLLQFARSRLQWEANDCAITYPVVNLPGPTQFYNLDQKVTLMDVANAAAEIALNAWRDARDKMEAVRFEMQNHLEQEEVSTLLPPILPQIENSERSEESDSNNIEWDGHGMHFGGGGRVLN